MHDFERRRHERRETFVAVAIETAPERQHVGLTRDLSDSGALILTQARLEEGQRIRVVMLGSGGQHERDGWVVRRSPLGPGGVWTSVVAVEFGEPPAP
jgi:hypothetical protein